MIEEGVAPIPVSTIESIGIPVDAREVLTMVALGNETALGHPGNVPSATGASHRVISGDITPGRAG